MVDLRRLRSYDDIAEYIVEQIRFNTVDNLPDTFFEALGPYSHTQTYQMFSTNSLAPVHIRFDWHADARRFDIAFVLADGSILHRLVLQPPVKTEHAIRTFGTHDASGKRV